MKSEKLMKAGKYYIGDPGYVVADEDWETLLVENDYLSGGVYMYKGHEIMAGGTAYGDGMYADQKGCIYPVDAGLIALMPLEVVDDLEDAESSGALYEFEDDFYASYENGVYNFGGVRIDTTGHDEEDDDYYDDEDDDE